MSRAKPVAEREALDFYATPEALALAICRHLSHNHYAQVVEPSAGHGPFVRAARVCWPGVPVVAVDVACERLGSLADAGAEAVLVSDWMEIAALPATSGLTLIVGNPPYREAEDHIRHALSLMHPGDVLAFLLRLNLLGSLGRVGLWTETPLVEVVPVVPRPSFTGGGSDATEYALFVWRKGHTGPTTLGRPMLWRAARSEKGVG